MVLINRLVRCLLSMYSGYLKWCPEEEQNNELIIETEECIRIAKGELEQ